jgi:nicotinate phosphoribosyltransferase
VLTRADEQDAGRPLLEQVMKNGIRLRTGRITLDASRERAREELQRLPARVRGLAAADPPYQVVISEALRSATEALRREHVVSSLR